MQANELKFSSSSSGTATSEAARSVSQPKAKQSSLTAKAVSSSSQTTHSSKTVHMVTVTVIATAVVVMSFVAAEIGTASKMKFRPWEAAVGDTAHMAPGEARTAIGVKEVIRMRGKGVRSTRTGTRRPMRGAIRCATRNTTR